MKRFKRARSCLMFLRYCFACKNIFAHSTTHLSTQLLVTDWVPCRRARLGTNYDVWRAIMRARHKGVGGGDSRTTTRQVVDSRATTRQALLFPRVMASCWSRSMPRLLTYLHCLLIERTDERLLERKSANLGNRYKKARQETKRPRTNVTAFLFSL